MMRTLEVRRAARQTTRSFVKTIPIVLGILALVSLATSALPPESLSDALPMKGVLGLLFAALFGSVAAGNPLTGVVIYGRIWTPASLQRYPSAGMAISAVYWCHGARADLRWSRRRKHERSAWQESLLARRPTNVVLVAMANKTARVAWALLRRGETFRGQALIAT